MQSFKSALACVSVVALAIVGCTSSPDARPVSEGKQTHVAPSRGVKIQDSYGYTVELKASPSKIASLAPGFTEILFEIGCGDRVVIRDRWSDFPREATRLEAVDGHEPSVSIIAGYDPDLVLLCFDNPVHRGAFAKLGIPMAVLKPGGYDGVVENVLKLGKVCGEDERARKLADEMSRVRREVEASVGDVEGPLVYVELDGTDPSRPWTAGPGSFIDGLLQISGARNAAAAAGSQYAQVTAEAIIRSNPDYILLLTPGIDDPAKAASDIAARPGWSNVKAVERGQVIHHIDSNLLSRPGPRLATGLRLLHEALHPDGAGSVGGGQK